MLDRLVTALRPPELGPGGRDDGGVSRGTLAAIAAAFAVGYACLFVLGLRGFPASGDEYSYELQAQLFARGQLAARAPAHASLFQVDHVLFDPTVRSKYGPGWPLLLALGELARAPWFVNPLLAALTLLLLHWTARRVYGGGAALAAMLLAGFSPYFAFQAASLFSHIASLFALVAFVALLVRGWPRRELSWAAAAGAALGFSALNRPLDTVIYGVGLLALSRRAPRYVLACVASAAAVGSLLLVYNTLQFGSPLTTGYALHRPLEEQLYGTTSSRPIHVANVFDLACQWHHAMTIGELISLLAPGLTVVGVAGLLMRRDWDDASGDGCLRQVLVVAAATQLALVPFFTRDVIRYFFPLVAPIALGAAAAWAPLWRFVVGRANQASLATIERRVALAVVLVLAAGIARGAFHLDAVREDVLDHTRLYDQVEQAGVREPAVVIVKDEFPAHWTRNGLTFDGPILYVRPMLDDASIASFFPGRTPYVASRPHAGQPWTIAPLR
jgi:hypothetical protein